MTSSIYYEITPHSAWDYLGRFARLLSMPESEMQQFVEKLASGNLSIGVSALYYFLHSNKLPLTKLFQLEFAKHAADDREKALVTTDEIIEGLLAIHYPFFDVDKSPLLNVFKGFDEIPKDFRKTLVIPRILGILASGKLKFRTLIARLGKAGYPPDIAYEAFDRCLQKGLFGCSWGHKVDHFEESSDASVRLSRCGKLYWNHLLWRASYLQYVCEDVEMEEKWQVPILDKYEELSSGSRHMQSRLNAVRKFVLFIESEEEAEKEWICRKGRNYTDHLTEFGVREGKTGRATATTLSAHMKKTVLPYVRTLLQGRDGHR